MLLPTTFTAVPKNFIAVFWVMTSECSCAKAEEALPSTKGSVNMLNMDASAYLPPAKTDLSPTANKNEVNPSETRQVLAMPGMSACIAGPSTPGVEECVKVRES